MIPEIWLVHGERAADEAQRLQQQLERNTGVRVLTLPCRAGELPEVWEEAAGGSGIILLLSPDAVPATSQREKWSGLLRHAEERRPPPLFVLRLEDCPYPKVLERGAFGGLDRDSLRAIEGWALSFFPETPDAGRSLAAVPGFAGMQMDLEYLRQRMVDAPGREAVVGPAGSGKTSLVQELARRASGQFLSVVWVSARGRSPAAVREEIDLQIGSAPPRVLLVVDEPPPEFAWTRRGRESVLVTSAGRAPAGFGEWHLDARPPVQRALDRMAALCRRDAAPAALLTGFTGLEPFTADGRLWRVPAGARPDESLRETYAEAVFSLLGEPDVLPEARTALAWAAEHDWPFAQRLARRAAAEWRKRRRFVEAAEIFDALLGAAREREDDEVRRECAWELSWLRDGEGGFRHASAPAQQTGFDFS